MGENLVAFVLTPLKNTMFDIFTPPFLHGGVRIYLEWVIFSKQKGPLPSWAEDLSVYITYEEERIFHK